ncbi:MAG: cytochrome c-type biogenesis protein CcmH [Anaerolineae bacterium]|nr:MAG: cytochrome c-type biogenesis protein CcmH [Anaerolineae bacterium]
MKRWSGLMALLLLIGLLSGLAVAQGEVTDDEVNAVAKELYCPICENTPLDVCGTQACKDWRALIRQQLRDGWTEEQILDYFVANYGPQVLAQPPVSGFTVLVWVLPVVGLAGGGVFLWQRLRRWQAHRPAVEAAPGDAASGVSPETLARIEREVKERF